MSQVYDSTKPEAGVTTFPQLFQIVKDHIAAVISRFSGTSFPANPTTYQICWRSDRGIYGLAYTYTGNPAVGENGWIEDVLLTTIGIEVIAARGSKSSLDERLDVALNEDGTLKAATTLSPSQWFTLSGHTFTYVSGASFTVDGDQTDIYKATRRIKANITSGAVYSEVVSATYGSPNTSVVIKDSILDNTLTTVEHSLFLPRINSGALSHEMIANKNVRTVTDTTSSTINDSIIICNKATAMTVNLVSAAIFGGGRRLTIININIGVVTIDAAGTETINGNLTKLLSSQYDVAEIESDGTNWLLLSAGTAFSTTIQALAGAETALSVAPDTLKATRAADAAFWGIKNLRLIKAKVGDNTRVQVNPDAMNIALNIGDHNHIMTAAVDVDATDDLDTGTLAAGTDYYVYACTDGTTLSFKVSLASTYPAGFDANHSRKIGGFHTLCLAVGTISGHSLTTFIAKDILPASVWCLKHRAKTLVNTGLVYDSNIQKWVQIYLASGTGASTTSVNGGTISDTRTWLDFVDDGLAIGMRLPNDMEFQSFATGSNEETNIYGSGDPGTTGGHSDTSSRRMISNIGCEDCCGVMYQWLLDQGWYSRTENWYDLPGSKGSSYDSGDCKLIAGGNWDNAALAGSRCRSAGYRRWDTNTHLGARFVAEPL